MEGNQAITLSSGAVLMSFPASFVRSIVVPALFVTASLTVAGAQTQVAGMELPTGTTLSLSTARMPLEAVPAKAAGAAGGSSMGALPTAAPGMFSAVIVSVKAGSTGLGVDVATSLGSRLALRTGASYFKYNTSFNTDGLTINGGLHLQNLGTSLDIYPFRGRFRISPGYTFSNKNSMSATLLVPGGQSFSLGDGGDYTSDPSNPIHGTASFKFGNKFAPKLTMGVSSLFPQHGGRFSMPLEIGAQYTSAPTVTLAISGNSCGSQVQTDGTTDSGCGPVDQTNVVQEQQTLQSDLKPLRFYPIATVGVAVRFGSVGRRD
jgi:hypothetical protein